MRSLGLAIAHWRIVALYEMQYRVNFFVQLVHSGLSLLTGLVAIGLVFSNVADLNGWTRPELLLVLGVHTMLGAVVSTFIQPNLQQMMWDVLEGDFDFVLTRPADSLLMTSIRQIRMWHLVDILVGLVVIGWGIGDLPNGVGILDAVAFVVMMVAGVAIMYALWVILCSTAFNWVRVEELTQLLTGTYEAGRWPVSIYPGWLRSTLTAVIPLAFAITVPAEALAGRLTSSSVVTAIIVAVVFSTFARLAWVIGIRNYSGASA